MRPVFLAATLVLCLAAAAPAQTLRIYHIDVEQADAHLIVMPNGKSLLIDSGNNRQGKRIRKVMAQAGVTQIDAFVASHYHADHYGSIDELVDDGVPVLESFDRGRRDLLSEEDKQGARFRDYMRTVGEDAVALHPGDTIDLDALVKVSCIASSGEVLGATPVASHDENDLSVSLLLEFAGFKAFFGGDTHEPVEAVIAGLDLVKDIDLYKASHHGSDTSSSSPFMTDANPSLVVISNGSNRSYHHPREQTLHTYEALASAPIVLQTNRCKLDSPCGNVEDDFIADREISGKDGTIQIVVDATSRTYTAKYGLNTTRTFPFRAAGPFTPAPASAAVIQSLLPNPQGDDEQLEQVTVRNAGTDPLDLTGWTLRDRLGDRWTLIGLLPPGQSRTFQRNGQAMTLNNTGDEITLVDTTNLERDRFSYSTSSEGDRIETNH